MFDSQFAKYNPLCAYGRTKILNVFFYPAGPYQLLGISQNKLENTILNLNDLLGSTARELKEKLLDQTTVAGVKQVAESFFLRCLSRRKEEAASIRLASAIEQLGRYSHEKNVIKRICQQYGYSIKTLERHMQQMTGLRPKMLQRILRFNKVLKYLNHQPPPFHWARIARAFGYYDQMHLIKDFSWFHGTTPDSVAAVSSKLQMSIDFSGETDSASSIFRVYK